MNRKPEFPGDGYGLVIEAVYPLNEYVFYTSTYGSTDDVYAGPPVRTPEGIRCVCRMPLGEGSELWFHQKGGKRMFCLRPASYGNPFQYDLVERLGWDGKPFPTEVSPGACADHRESLLSLQSTTWKRITLSAEHLGLRYDTVSVRDRAGRGAPDIVFTLWNCETERKCVRTATRRRWSVLKWWPVVLGLGAVYYGYYY